MADKLTEICDTKRGEVIARKALARKLDAIQEGERTALDNSMLLYCSSMLTGGHDATNLPVVVLGGRAPSPRPRW